MKTLELTDEQYAMVLSGVAAEINHINALLRKKINETLRTHLEVRLKKINRFYDWLKENESKS